MNRKVSETSLWKAVGHIFSLNNSHMHGRVHGHSGPTGLANPPQAGADQQNVLHGTLAGDDLIKPRHYPPHHCSYLDDELIEREITDHGWE